MELTRRTFLTATAAASAGVLGLNLNGGAAMAAPVPYLPYSADSFFKSRVEFGPIDAARTTEFRNFMKTYVDQRAYAYPRLNGVGTNKWGTAWAEGQASDPIWRLTGTVPTDVAFLKTSGFHAPEWFGQMLSGTTDSPFVCMDRGSGMSVWAAKAKVVAPHTISVSSAGSYFHNTNGLDKRNPKSNSTKNFRSRGAIPDAMVIRRDVVDAAIANGTGLGYVLHLFLALTDGNAGFCHPMVGTETRNVGGFGAEGERIRLKPTVDVNARITNPVGRVIALTLRENGMYIGDNSGNMSALKMEQASATRNPWAGLTVNQDSLKGLTWDDFEVVSRGWQ